MHVVRPTILVALLTLTCTAALAVEFADYPYSNWSQEITECDRQASHGLDGIDMITNASDARFGLLGARFVGEETLNRFYVLGSTTSSVAPTAIRTAARRQCRIA